MPEIEILLIEDNKFDSEFVINIFKKISLLSKVRVIADGEEALDIFLMEVRDLPKLILLDLEIPKVSGARLLQKLKKNKKTQNIPVIILSNHLDEVTINDCQALGANGFLKKPFSLVDFANLTTALGLGLSLFSETKP